LGYCPARNTLLTNHPEPVEGVAVVERNGGRSPNRDEAKRLELIEQAMRELASQRVPDIPLLARLDRLRAQAREALRRG
jgi:hypothetical protein